MGGFRGHRERGGKWVCVGHVGGWVACGLGVDKVSGFRVVGRCVSAFAFGVFF